MFLWLLIIYLPDKIHVKYQNCKKKIYEIKCQIFWTTFKSSDKHADFSVLSVKQNFA